MKLENFLTDLHNFFFYASCYEMCAYFMQILFFLGKTQVNSVWFQVLGLLHILRALVGFYIARNLPSFYKLNQAAEL